MKMSADRIQGYVSEQKAINLQVRSAYTLQALFNSATISQDLDNIKNGMHGSIYELEQAMAVSASDAYEHMARHETLMSNYYIATPAEGTESRTIDIPEQYQQKSIDTRQTA